MEPLQLSPASIYRPPASQALTSTTKVQLKREIEDDCISAAMPHKKMRHDNELDVTPKRERKIEACLWCRERKVKCSRDKPTCERCQRDKKDCVYWGYEGEDKTTAEITNCTIRKIKDESRNLARTARKEAYRAKSRNVGGDELDDSERSDDEDVPDDHEYFSRTSPIATGNVTINGDDPYDQKFPCRTPPIAAGVVSEDNAEPEDQKYPMPTPLVTADAVYADDAECEGFGVQFGKCRISDRIGGFFRPKMAEEVGTY